MIFWKSTKSLKRVDFFSLRFSQTCEFWSSKANRRLRFSLPSIILTDLLGNKTLLRSWFLICDWRISIRFVCSCISRFVTCDRNYDWRQPKTQLWGRLLNFRVRMFLKSTVRQEKTSKDSKRRFSVYCMLLGFASMDQLPFIRVEEAVSWTQLFNKKNLAQKSKDLYDKQFDSKCLQKFYVSSK